MFGYRKLGQLDSALLTCAAEGPLGTVWVGCSGARTTWWTLSNGRWAGTYAPGLFRLEDEEFIAHADFDGDDRWVYGMLPDDTGLWLAGGIAGEGAALWRLESGVVVHEVTRSGAGNVAELAELSGVLYAMDERLYKRTELSLEQVLTPDADPEGSLVALRDRLYWTTEDGETAWMQGDTQESADNDTLSQGIHNAHATFHGRLWSIVSDDVGISLLHDGADTQGPRIMPDLTVDDPVQELAWFDGHNWRSVARWHVNDVGMYARLAAFGGALWLFGELWDADAQDHAEQPCVAIYDGETLTAGRPWPYWVDRITVSERRAIIVGDDSWYGQPVYADSFTNWQGPSCVLEADVDLRIRAVIQEYGDGTGESPVVSSIEQEYGDGSGDGPTVTEIRQEFSQAASGPGGSESILWLTDTDTANCVAVRVTTGAGADIDTQLRAVIRCDKEAHAVTDWGTYQELALNAKVTVNEPGLVARVGVIKPNTVDDETAVNVQLLREN